MPSREYDLQSYIILTDDSNSKPIRYIGSAGTTVKNRFANHKESFHHEKYKSSTELSKEFWKLKRKNNNKKLI